MLRVHDVLEEAAHRFRPVVHLRTGGVMALEVHAWPAEGGLGHLRLTSGIVERRIRLDVALAAEGVRRAAGQGTLLPLHLSLWADTLCAAHDPLRPLLDTLRRLGRSTGQVVIRLIVPPGEPTLGDLETGLARLRAAGFGVGLDAAAAHPISTLIDARPEVLVLDAGLIAGLPGAPGARATLDASIALAAQAGATLIADGCDSAEQAVALRARGVYLVQGRLLGPPSRRPHTEPIPGVVLDQLTTPTAPGPDGTEDAETDPDATESAEAGRAAVEPAQIGLRRPCLAADLAHPAATVPADANGDAVRAVFADQPHLTGVVLVDVHQRPLLTLNRDRFMLAITGPFGHSLYARRPAAGLADPPRTLGLQTGLSDVIALVADAPTERMHDDLVLVDDHGRCQGVLRIRDLVRDIAQRHATSRRDLSNAG